MFSLSLSLGELSAINTFLLKSRLSTLMSWSVVSFVVVVFSNLY